MRFRRRLREIIAERLGNYPPFVGIAAFFGAAVELLSGIFKVGRAGLRKWRSWVAFVRSMYIRVRRYISDALNLTLTLNTSGTWILSSYPLLGESMKSWARLALSILIFVVAEFSAIFTLSSNLHVRNFATFLLVIAVVLISSLAVSKTVKWKFKENNKENQDYRVAVAIMSLLFTTFIILLNYFNLPIMWRAATVFAFTACLIYLASVKDVLQKLKTHGLMGTNPRDLLFYDVYWAMNLLFIGTLIAAVVGFWNLDVQVREALLAVSRVIPLMNENSSYLGPLQDFRGILAIGLFVLLMRSLALDHLEISDRGRLYAKIHLPDTFGQDLNDHSRIVKRDIEGLGRIIYTEHKDLQINRPAEVANLFNWIFHVQKASGRPIDITGRVRLKNGDDDLDGSAATRDITTEDVMDPNFRSKVTYLCFRPTPKWHLAARDAVLSATVFTLPLSLLFICFDALYAFSDLPLYLDWVVVAIPVTITRFLIIRGFVQRVSLEIDVVRHKLIVTRAYGWMVLKPQTIFYDLNSVIVTLATNVTTQHILSNRPTKLKFLEGARALDRGRTVKSPESRR